MLARLRDDPLCALIGLEVGAALFAYAIDMAIVRIGAVPRVRFTLESWSLYTVLFLIGAWAIFAIPHAPNRKFALVPVAALAIGALTALPQTAWGAAVLFTALAVRLTFAFGLRGSITAWATATFSVGTMAAWQLISRQPGVTLPIAAAEVAINLLAITLMFGIIAIIWLYANKAATNAASAERVRIALDLHDSLGHSLTTLTVQLQNAERLRQSDPAKADAYVKRASTTAADALEDVRETVMLLHDNATCTPAPFPMLLEHLRDDFAATHNVDLAWSTRLTKEQSGRITLAIYRVLQEALTNVARHANARRVEVSILEIHSGIEVTVRDDGIGFKQSNAKGHGLTSMRSRVESIGGTLAIVSNTGRGTVVQAHVPMEALA